MKGVNNKSMIVYIENISNKMTKEQQNNIIIDSNIHNEKSKDNKSNIQLKEINNPIDTCILSSIHKHKYSLVLNDNIILFEYFSNEKQAIIMKSDSLFVLYNEIIIYHYSKWCYHINNITLNKHTNVIFKEKISNAFYNLSPKLLKEKTHIMLLTSNYNLIKLTFDSNTKSMLHYTTLSHKPYIDQLFFNNPLYNHFTFYEIDRETFLLVTIDSIFLFDKGITDSVLLHQINISFSKYPYPIRLHSYDLCFISSEQFLYQVNISSKQSHSLSLFGDLSLNFNNEKYKEMMEIIKIILYYHIEIQKKSLEEVIMKEKQLTLLFEHYDLHSYIENLSSVISEDNATFFINYNLNSSKLQVIIIYSIIYRKHGLLNKLIKIMSANEGNCLLFIVFLEDVVIDFFSLFESIQMKELNQNLLSSISISNRKVDIDRLNNYYDISK